MDEFVSAVWQHMDQWGIAVAGGYWKPELRVTWGTAPRSVLRNCGPCCKAAAWK